MKFLILILGNFNPKAQKYIHSHFQIHTKLHFNPNNQLPS